AVVDRRPHARHLQTGQRAELVLGERLRRVEVERAPFGLACERVEYRQVEGERLPARRAGDDRDVLAALRRRPGVRLVLVELADAEGLESPAFLRGKPVGERGRPRPARGLRDDVRELLTLEDAGPGSSLDRHAASVAVG